MRESRRGEQRKPLNENNLENLRWVGIVYRVGEGEGRRGGEGHSDGDVARERNGAERSVCQRRKEAKQQMGSIPLKLLKIVSY